MIRLCSRDFDGSAALLVAGDEFRNGASAAHLEFCGGCPSEADVIALPMGNHRVDQSQPLLDL